MGKHLTVRCCALLASTALCSPSWAQSEPPGEDEPEQRFGGQRAAIDTIVVTARKKEESLQDVAIAVTVADGETISKEATRDLQGLTTRLPAVRIAGRGVSDAIFIRGVGSGVNGGFEQSVATFVDGVYRGRARFSRGNLVDVERVEVLKGPQPILLGNNAVAGAFNIITKKPGTETDGYLSVLYHDEHEELDIQGAATLPITDNLSVRGAFRYYELGGWVENEGLGRTEPNFEDFFARVSARYEPTDKLKFDWRLEYGDSDANDAFGVELGDCPPNPARFSPPPGAPLPPSVCQLGLFTQGANFDGSFDRRAATDTPNFNQVEFLETSLAMEYNIGDYVLNTITAWNSLDYDQLSDGDVTNVPGQAPIAGGSPGFVIRIPEEARQFSQEIRLSSSLDGPFNYVLGGYAQIGEVQNQTNVGLYLFGETAIPPNAVFPGSPPLTLFDVPTAQAMTNDQDEELFALFGSFTYELTERLRVAAGLRYQHIEKSVERTSFIGEATDPLTLPIGSVAPTISPLAQAAIGAQALVPLLDGLELEIEDDAFTPSATIEFDVRPGAMAYASYAEGYKAGGFDFSNTVFRDLDGSGGNPNTPEELDPFVFDEETVRSYELGLKSSWLGNSLQTNIAVFRSVYQDLQQSTINPDGLTFAVTNSGEVLSQGVEFDIRSRPRSWVELGMNIALLDASFEDFEGAPVTAQQAAEGLTSQDLTGAETPFAPDYSGNIFADIRLPVAGGSYELSLLPNFFFSDSFFFSIEADEGLRQDAYSIFDLRAGFGPSDGRWEVALVGKNLTDEDVFTTLNFAPQSVGSLAGSLNRPRSVAIQARLAF